MKLKYEFCYQAIGDIYMGVAVGDEAADFSGTLQLDEVAYDIVSHIKDNISRDELVDEMLEIYDADRKQVGEYVDKVLDYLRTEEILVD